MFPIQLRKGRGWIARYVVAVAFFSVSLFVRLTLEPYLGDRIPFSVFLPAIIIQLLQLVLPPATRLGGVLKCAPEVRPVA